MNEINTLPFLGLSKALISDPLADYGFIKMLPKSESQEPKH